jgi:TetR/AcrR family transcriptional repressor of nem operon
MAKPSHRTKILTEGLRVVHEQGYAGASVRDIVQAAGVPQGSFTNHFASKEAFGLEVIDLYFENALDVMRDTLRNDALPPLARLRGYIDAGRTRLNQHEMRRGCLFGNFAAEASEHSETIRLRLVAIFAEVRSAIEYCLNAADLRLHRHGGVYRQLAAGCESDGQGPSQPRPGRAVRGCAVYPALALNKYGRPYFLLAA